MQQAPTELELLCHELAELDAKEQIQRLREQEDTLLGLLNEPADEYNRKPLTNLLQLLTALKPTAIRYWRTTMSNYRRPLPRTRLSLHELIPNEASMMSGLLNSAANPDTQLKLLHIMGNRVIRLASQEINTLASTIHRLAPYIETALGLTPATFFRHTDIAAIALRLPPATAQASITNLQQHCPQQALITINFINEFNRLPAPLREQHVAIICDQLKLLSGDETRITVMNQLQLHRKTSLTVCLSLLDLNIHKVYLEQLDTLGDTPISESQYQMFTGDERYAYLLKHYSLAIVLNELPPEEIMTCLSYAIINHHEIRIDWLRVMERLPQEQRMDCFKLQMATQPGCSNDSLDDENKMSRTIQRIKKQADNYRWIISVFNTIPPQHHFELLTYRLVLCYLIAPWAEKEEGVLAETFRLLAEAHRDPNTPEPAYQIDKEILAIFKAIKTPVAHALLHHAFSPKLHDMKQEQQRCQLSYPKGSTPTKVYLRLCKLFHSFYKGEHGITFDTTPDNEVFVTEFQRRLFAFDVAETKQAPEVLKAFKWQQHFGKNKTLNDIVETLTAQSDLDNFSLMQFLEEKRQEIIDYHAADAATKKSQEAAGLRMATANGDTMKLLDKWITKLPECMTILELAGVIEALKPQEEATLTSAVTPQPTPSAPPASTGEAVAGGGEPAIEHHTQRPEPSAPPAVADDDPTGGGKLPPEEEKEHEQAHPQPSAPPQHMLSAAAPGTPQPPAMLTATAVMAPIPVVAAAVAVVEEERQVEKRTQLTRSRSAGDITDQHGDPLPLTCHSGSFSATPKNQGATPSSQVSPGGRVIQ